MASEDQGNRQEGQTTIDSGDLYDMIRGGKPDESEVDKFVKDEVEPEVETREPEVRAEDDKEEVVRAERSPDLERALSTIERQAALLESMSTRTPARGGEPEIETIDIFPGVKLPKDESRWPIQLTPEMLSSIGLHPGEKGEVARAFNVLGNAFFMIVSNAVGEGAIRGFEARQAEREAAVMRKSAFETAYPDLRGNDDLVFAIEQNMRRERVNLQGKSDKEYAAELATRARVRLAALRGVPFEDYMRGIRNNNSDQRNRGNGSRARVTSGARMGRAPRQSENDRELNDML